MQLSNLHTIGQSEPQHIQIENGIIRTITGNTAVNSTPNVQFDNAIAIPGLINSHDHLDFNVFPQLGNGIYPDYREWGNDINSRKKNSINDVLKVPKALRIRWGMYKNLLNGVTTVVNHGEALKIRDSIVNVFQDCHSLHSLHFEKHWKWKLNTPFKKKKPIVMHTGEGTNAGASQEIDALIRGNIFKKALVGVHGVAMNTTQARSFKALVWCPASNVFLLNATANINALKSSTCILFGSDSTLSASWNIWEHIQLAREFGCLSDEELLESLTSTAAAIWGLADRGRLEQGYRADLLIVKKQAGETLTEQILMTRPENILMVVNAGRVKLFDESLFDQMHELPGSTNNFSSIIINGNKKYVEGNLPGLMNEIKKYHRQVSFPVEAH